MSSHHDQHDHPVSESKPVSFGVPMILGLVTTLIILLFVSLGDPCHGHCACNEEGCSKECMKEGAEGEHAAAKHEHGEEAHATEATAPATEATAEEAAAKKEEVPAAEAAPVKDEVKKEEAHH